MKEETIWMYIAGASVLFLIGVLVFLAGLNTYMEKSDNQHDSMILSLSDIKGIMVEGFNKLTGRINTVEEKIDALKVAPQPTAVSISAGAYLEPRCDPSKVGTRTCFGLPNCPVRGEITYYCDHEQVDEKTYKIGGCANSGNRICIEQAMALKIYPYN